jgi:polysaccharide biosynthesis protein VpsM
MSSYRCLARSRGAVLFGLILGLIPVFGLSAPAGAVGNLKLGPVEFHPFFQISELIDDNVCRTEKKVCEDPKDSTRTKKGSDQITLFSPGLQILLPLQDHRFEAEYRGDFGRYVRFKPENYSDNHLKGDLSLNFPGGLSIRLKEAWTDGHDPRGYAQNIDLDFYHRNTAGAGVEMRVGPKLRVAVDYTNLLLNYAVDARNGFRDRTDDTVGGTVYFKFLPKTSALLEYNVTSVKFDDPDPAFGNVKLDSKVQRGYLGLTWDITSRSQGTLKGGYVRKDFKESGLEDFKGGIVWAGLSHQLTTRTSVRLDGERDVRESNVGTQTYYISNGGHLTLDHQIHSTVSFKLGGGFIRDQYPKADPGRTQRRLDDTWTAGARLNYRFQKWLDFGVGYDHSQRRSVFDEFGYIDNLYSVTLGAIL